MPDTTTDDVTTADGRTSVGLTRSLLGCGVLAGPLYMAVGVVQGLTRDGFDFTRHQFSLLTNGDLGWLQVANLMITGLLLVLFAVGLRRALSPGAASRWAPILVSVFGVGMVAAGIFRADPALGFPPGTPETAAQITTTGIVHFAAAGVGFVAVAAACFVLARRQARDGYRGSALFSRITGIAFLGGFFCVASGIGSIVANLLFLTTVVLVFTWLTVTAVHYYRTPG